MANKAAFKVVILWEDEIRLAAKSLHSLAREGGATSDDINNALAACVAAILPAGDDKAALMLGIKPEADRG